MATKKTANGTVEALRKRLAETAAAEERVRAALRKAERENRSAGRELMKALAADLAGDLTSFERRGLGLPAKGGA